MIIRNTLPEDIDGVAALFEGARRFMRQNGNMNQWINGYPSRELTVEDVRLGRSYVVEDNGELLATFVMLTEDDPTYKVIDGKWLNDEPYGTLHRIASRGKPRGISDFIVDWAFERMGNLRGDTHEDNLPMRRAFERNGFEYCGTIWIEDGSPRRAYHKISR